MPFYAYMTIDDGPSLDFLDKLDLLDKNHIPAVWFCQGNYLEQRPDMAYDSYDWGPSNLEIAPPAFKTPEQVLIALQKWTLHEQAEPLRDPVANMILMHDFSGTIGYDLFSDMVKLLVEKGIQFRSCAD